MKKGTKRNKTSQANFSNNNSPIVVGIGASAGGLEAIQVFFKHMPKDSDLAFVVVQHLSPDYKSLMDELLLKYTRMTIHKVTESMEVKPNSIYLIPPGKNMTIFHNQLFLTKQDPGRGINLPIDIFLRSLAKDKGRNAVAVILSGTGSDGALGIRAIKEAGGMVMVQDDKSAKFDGMPRSSIATGIVDFILPADKLPEKLLAYIQHPFISELKDIKNELDDAQDALTKIIMLIREYSGIDFSFYKTNTIIRRIEKRIGINQLYDLESYISYLEDNSEEIEILYKELLIGVTRFFRDKEAFDILQEKTIPKILENATDKTQIRVWSAGCSTGEEAYSTAILFREYMDENHIEADVKIFATDLDQQSVEYAGVGIYPENVISDISPERISKYFKKIEGKYQVSEKIRRMVVFATQNIIKDPPFSKLDLILCRNMLIYFKPETQKKILSMFYFSLRSSGFLFLGSSESIGEYSTGFAPVSVKWKIFKYKAGFRPEISRDVPLTSIRTQLRHEASYETGVKKTFERIFFDVLLNQLLTKYIPPSVIVDENYNILHIIQDINKYIKLPQGKITYNLLKLINSDISVIVSSILRKVKKDNQQVVFEDVGFEASKNKKQLVDIIANALYDEKSKQNYYVVSFQEKKQKPKATKAEKIDVNSQYHERLVELEKELQFTKESLQATVEELETSNEELQSSNEELIASNEELQSTNEELQSVNEELYTVNAEHQQKIHELTLMSNDMDNLLKNTEIGTIFLDIDLKIRKITDHIYDNFKILRTDVGRPINDLVISKLYPRFISDIKRVLKSLKRIDKEIKFDGNYYSIRILPYRNEEDAVSGVIISFININEVEKAKVQIEREKDLLQRILENSPLAKSMVNENGKITYINKKGEKVLGMTLSDIKKRKFNDHNWKIVDEKGMKIQDSELPFSLIMKNKKEIKDYRHYITKPSGEKVLLSIHGAPIFNENQQVTGAVFTMTEME